MEKMLRENNERMLSATVEQLCEFAQAQKEKGAIPNQSETTSMGGASAGSAPGTFRKVNTIITLRSEKKIDNHIGDNLNEKCNTSPITNADDFGESKEDEPTVTVTKPPPKTTLTRPVPVQKPLASQLKGKKDQAYIDTIKDTFFRVKINIPLLDAI